MTAPPASVRRAAAGLGALAAFTLVFGIGHVFAWWPEPPARGFRGTDLAAGLAFGAVLLVTLVAPRRP
ncbi:MAG TPA: hypothetical protein VMH79_16795 [Thermoanaerobaculia bacterium]|nr:hypothetical protein [Thermoanaerobaculia bacterium]